MQEIKAYKTTKGEIFETKDEAIRSELEVLFSHEIVEAIMRKKSELVKLLETETIIHTKEKQLDWPTRPYERTDPYDPYKPCVPMFPADDQPFKFWESPVCHINEVNYVL